MDYVALSGILISYNIQPSFIIWYNMPQIILISLKRIVYILKWLPNNPNWWYLPYRLVLVGEGDNMCFGPDRDVLYQVWSVQEVILFGHLTEP